MLCALCQTIKKASLLHLSPLLQEALALQQVEQTNTPIAAHVETILDSVEQMVQQQSTTPFLQTMRQVLAYNSARYSLILMDWQMPLMDGLMATHFIRQHEASTGRRLPIIGVTANAIKGDCERCLAVGMDDYMSKPVRREELQWVLTQWLPSAL